VHLHPQEVDNNDAGRDCPPCQHALEHGWWETTIPARHTRCRDCHRTFRSAHLHCVRCHETFSSVSAADLHTPQGENGFCRRYASLLAHRDQNGVVWSRPALAFARHQGGGMTATPIETRATSHVHVDNNSNVSYPPGRRRRPGRASPPASGRRATPERHSSEVVEHQGHLRRAADLPPYA
jgi:hypothetical protein